MGEFRDTLTRSLLMILLLTVPSSVGLAILGESMIGLVYQHGRFLANDTRQTALALSCYAVGLAGYAAVRLLAPAFYALGDARTPMMVSMASVLVNAGTSFATVRYFGLGHAGLALSLSAVSIFNAAALLGLIGLKIGGIDGRRMAAGLGKILLACAPMGVVCTLIVHVSPSRLAQVAIGIPSGALAFYAAARTLGLLNSEQTHASRY